MLNPQMIANIRGFLSRTTLRGEEVPAFNQVMTALAIEENEFNMREQMKKAAQESEQAKAA